MRILLTGCTSQQANHTASTRVMNYPALLRRALQYAGHEVWWSEPTFAWTTDTVLKRYDAIIVGLAPVTSLSANRLYPALALVERLMQRAPQRLAVLVDAPEPIRITAGIASVLAAPDTLVKPFYSYRKEYPRAVQHRDLLIAALERQRDRPWPTTFVPTLPWQSTAPGRLDGLPPRAGDHVVRLCLDRVLFGQLPTVPVPLASDRRRAWVVERSGSAPVTWPQYEISRRGQAATDASVMRQLAHARGALVHVSRAGSWWTHRYAQALAVDTPVFGDWRETQALGDAWHGLPASVEDLTPEQGVELARAQREQYLAACPTTETITDCINRALRSTRALAH